MNQTVFFYRTLTCKSKSEIDDDCTKQLFPRHPTPTFSCFFLLFLVVLFFATPLGTRAPALFEGLEQPEEPRRLANPAELDAERLHLDEKVLHIDDLVADQGLWMTTCQIQRTGGGGLAGA